MLDPLARLSRDEQVRLDSLGPHTRAHAVRLLTVVSVLRVSSGRRSPRHNQRVGGAPGSFHLVGRAVDFVGPLAALTQAASLVRGQRIGPRCTGPEEVLVHDVGTGTHLHVAW